MSRQHYLYVGMPQGGKGLEVKLCPSPEGTHEVFILCRSSARKEKEKAMHNLFHDRIRQGLERLKKNCNTGRVKTINVAEWRIGRLLQKNQRASSIFDITVKEQDGHINVDWTEHANDTDWARTSEGCYLLRSNIKDWTPQDLWKAYIQLTDAEEAFRIQKHDLQLRPIWHQKENRVKAHISRSIISYGNAGWRRALICLFHSVCVVDVLRSNVQTCRLGR